MMFCYYIIENKKKLGKLKPTDFLVKTIVTTEVIAEIARRTMWSSATATQVSSGLHVR